MLDFSKIYKATKKDTAINTRIPEELYNKYKNISRETNYSFNGLILYAMNYGLNDNTKKIYKTSKEDIAINLRIPKELYNEYKKLKKELSRSINSLIVSSMYYFIENKYND